MCILMNRVEDWGTTTKQESGDILRTTQGLKMNGG